MEREILRREFMSPEADGASPTIEPYLFSGICPGEEFPEMNNNLATMRYVEPEDVLDMDDLPESPILRICLRLTGWM